MKIKDKIKKKNIKLLCIQCIFDFIFYSYNIETLFLSYSKAIKMKKLQLYFS